MTTSGRRNVAVLAASVFGLALGEELWHAYLPAYLSSLGAGAVTIGLFGSCRDLLDSAYQYPGGWLADRIGRRRALLLFTFLATAGYATYALAPSWPVVFAGLFGVMAWRAGAFPTTFAVIGDSLPRERRARAFSVQSILVRAPRVIGAPLGGLLIVGLGMQAGFRTAVAVTIAIALVVLTCQWYGFADDRDPVASERRPSVRRIYEAMPRELRLLLVADCLVRVGEGLALSFIVLYVMQVRGFDASAYGVLYAVQQLVAILSYLPGGRFADMSGRAPVIAVTFVFFAAFPLAVRLAGSYPELIAAFVAGGLKEVGEPARKSLIVDLAPDDWRASTVGVYYGIRNLLVVPAGVAGGLLWKVRPELPLEAAAAVSSLGLVVFLATASFRDRTTHVRV